MVVRQTLAQGRHMGLATAFGIGSGIVFHVAFGMFALGWTVERFPSLIEVLRYGGALLLAWMGVRALTSRPAASSTGASSITITSRSTGRAYALGLATNLLNPKAALFFVALCSSVVSAGASPGLRFALGLWMAIATAAWFSFVAFTVGHEAVRARLAAQAHRIDHAMGAILIALALAVVVDGWRS